LPEGVAVYVEVAPLGPGRSQKRHYVRVAPRSGESNEDAWRRVLPWLNAFRLPVDERWAWEPVLEPDESRDDDGWPRSWHVVGLRTFVLTGDAVITTRDVVAADVGVDEHNRDQAYVLVTLSDEGAERFHQMTKTWVGKRLAIVVDGHIDSAPVIKSPISGGRVTITMGAGDPDKQLAEARALAASLR
jgi:preprotein translocase subunit SecD